MTIGSNVRDDAIGNGTATVYPFTFKIFSKTHLAVMVRDTDDDDAVDIPLTLDVDYTVSDESVNKDDGGEITLLSAGQTWINGSGKLDDGQALTIVREVPLEQNTDIKNQGSFYAKTHEEVFDYLMMAIQQVNLDTNLFFKLPLSIDPEDFDTTLPANMPINPGSMFIINADGNGFILGPDASQIIAAQGYAIAAAASAAAAAASAAAALISQTAATSSATVAATAASNAATSATTAVQAAILDVATAVAWNGDATHAPSRNVVYDAFLAMLAIPKNILEVGGSMIAGKVAATYGFAYESQVIVSGTGTLYPLAIVNLTAAKFPSIFGLTPKFRIRWNFATNETLANTSFNVGLVPVTRPNPAGAAGLGIYTLGAMVVGSDSGLTSIGPVRQLFATDNAEFALPADGYYAIGLINNATLSASSHVHLNASLEFRYT